MYEFNDKNPAFNLGFHFDNYGKTLLAKSDFNKKLRKPLVEILCFCLMPNHYHFLIRPLTDQGITEFMRKIGTGYTNYFNKKYERSGVLFQGKFKAVLVDDEAQLLHLPYYIHSNPIDLIEQDWREHGISDFTKALDFLETYRWSSFLDYTGSKNFPSVISKDFITEIIGSPEEYKELIVKWLEEREWYAIEDLWLE
jgi:putative transposase